MTTSTATLTPLRDIERELSQQMKALHGPDDSPVQRARMANLVIFCNSPELAARVEADIPAVVAVHPARVLLLVGEPGPANEPVTATVSVRPIEVGHNHQAVAEQVTLRASGAAVERLPFTVRALLIGDLPTNLWWAAPMPPPLAGPLLYELGEHAQQIVYDSIGWPDPARGVSATASWLEQVERYDTGDAWRVASDLNWRRLKYWRRLLVQALDPVSAPQAAETTSEILIEHGPHAVVQAWELVSWLSRKLGWQVLTSRVEPGVEISWRCQSARDESTRIRLKRLEAGPAEVRRVRLTCKLEGQPGALNLVVEEPYRLAIHLEGVTGAPRTMVVPPHSPAELVGRQLSDRERDSVFRQAMVVAQMMARSVLNR
jgi:glucose-6-phosphate dehydrogenase assembly protein OpcA